MAQNQPIMNMRSFVPSHESVKNCLKTATGVVTWGECLKPHLEGCFTSLPSGESKFVLDYKGIAKMLHGLMPRMPAGDSILKLTNQRRWDHPLQHIHHIYL